MKNVREQLWWIFFTIGMLALPVVLNFIIFKPTSHLSVGTLQDWMSFWGSYLGATIPAIVAFVILSIQRKDNKLENEKNRIAISMRDIRKRRIDFWERTMNGEKDTTENGKEIRLLVKREQIGYDAHECFRYVYVCELYNMVFYSKYDKFERKTKKSLTCYWNEWVRVYR